MGGAADANRRVWDERAALHERSAFYGLGAFRAGGSTLRPVEVEELGDVLDALLGAGLRLDFLHEFPFCPYQKLACMEQGPDGWWRLKGQGGSVPLLFSLKARKVPE
jgi:hypothetical protein